jgi:hypothetical protein
MNIAFSNVSEYIVSIQKMKKHPRAITLAINKRKKEIENVMNLREEMIQYNIDNIMIQQFLDKEYQRINIEFEKKVKKHFDKEKKSENEKNMDELKKYREKAVNSLLKNKSVLEERGYTKKHIDMYVTKQYEFINNRYKGGVEELADTKELCTDIIDFID